MNPYIVNAFEIIRHWFDTHSKLWDYRDTRDVLRRWLVSQFPNLDQQEQDLALDCMCAVGIGDQKDQTQPVYCQILTGNAATYANHDWLQINAIRSTNREKS